MTKKMLFSNVVFVEIQGPNVLELLNYESTKATYQVNGFTAPCLFISDFRKKVNEILSECLIKDDLTKFAYAFSRPAQLVLERLSNGDFSLELRDTDIEVPDYMVWIVVGLQGVIPIYPHEFQSIQTINNDSYVGLVIYPLESEKMSPFIELSKSVSLFC
jgi:hypothetical protein